MTVGENGIGKTRLVNDFVREELNVTVNSKFLVRHRKNSKFNLKSKPATSAY